MTESLKVNPMVIIGKSKVKACKTLPYTTLSHSRLLLLRSPATPITITMLLTNERQGQGA